MFAELARRAFSFSARSARKKISSGDSSREGSAALDLGAGVGISESVGGEDGSWLTGCLEPAAPGESGVDLAIKLGIGSEEGAGEAWNVAPAKAAIEGALADMDMGGGGVCLPEFAGIGEAVVFLERCLLPVRDLAFEPGCSVDGLDLRGVLGLSDISLRNATSAPTRSAASFSEA
jgi:hypothetical protein